MERQKYYVSVQAHTIMANQGDAGYEFEIEATPDDLGRLNELFEELEDFDEASYIRNQLPGIPYNYDSENDGYDYFLKEIYRTLHQLGTAETKDHIATMNILE